MSVIFLLCIFFINKLVNCQYGEDNAVSKALRNTFNNITGGWHTRAYLALYSV